MNIPTDLETISESIFWGKDIVPTTTCLHCGVDGMGNHSGCVDKLLRAISVNPKMQKLQRIIGKANAMNRISDWMINRLAFAEKFYYAQLTKQVNGKSRCWKYNVAK